MQTRISVSTTKWRETSSGATVEGLCPEAAKGVKREWKRRLPALLAGLLVLLTTSLAFADQFYFTRVKAGGTSTGDEGATILVLWDDATGAQTLLSAPYLTHPVDGRVAVPAIATNGGTLYGLVVDDTSNGPLVPFSAACTALTCRSRLVTIDPGTGAVTYVGPWLDGYNFTGAGFDSSGRLWVLEDLSGDVYQVDPAAGTIIGSPIDTNAPSASFGDIDFVASGVGVVGFSGFAFVTFDPNTGAIGAGSFSATNNGFDGALTPPYAVAGVSFTNNLSARGASPAATTCRLNVVEGRGLDELGHVNDPWTTAAPVAFREAAQLDPGTLPANYMNSGPSDSARVGGSAFPACVFDFGDAPDTYASTVAVNGAGHQVGGPFLGAGLPDIDPDATANAASSGDDASGVDDEDGVVIPTLSSGATVQIQVTVGGASTDTRLQAWIDWGRDGSFAEPGDQILTDATVTPGLNSFTITVPMLPVPGTTYARFRIANSSGLTYQGTAATGEVEDHVATVIFDPPTDVFPTCPIDQQPPPTNFTIQQRWATPDVLGQRTLSYQTPVVGDLYGNGQPVVVVGADNAYAAATVPERVAKDLHIVNGLDGTILRTITTPLFGWSGQAVVALADVDGDGQGEIVLKVSEQAGVPAAQQGRLIAYRNDGTVLWTSDQRFDYAEPNGRNGMALGFADFNGDGVPEVYVGTQIFNARTGARLVAATSAASSGCPYRGNFGCFWGQTTAVDMDGDGQLELLAGNVVYKVNMTNTSGQAGNSLSVWQQAPAVAGVGDGFTAVADMDLDGDPDVVVVRTVDTLAGGETRIYVWEGETNALMGAVRTGIGTVGGPPLIADIDGDGAPEIVIQNSLALRAFRFQAGTGLVPKWTLATNDGSGQTSLSMFDFNNDGAQELVYRDQEQLRIIDGRGATAVNLTTFPCTSGTATEMPVIAALDSTREARILVTCGTDASGLPGSRGVLRAFETASFPWANTRPVWNQQAYFVTHVNNDLTIPSDQYPHWTAFQDPGQTCSTGVTRPLNAFQQQVTDLDRSTGCPVICPIPAEVMITKTAVPPDVLTPGGTITYTVTVTNTGPGAAVNALIQDPFPAGIASATWTCATSGGAVCPNANSGGPVLPPGDMLNQTVPTLPVGGVLTYIIAATVDAAPPPRVTNTVTATSPNMLCLPDRTPSPCTSTAIVPRPVVELVITKTSAPTPAVPGEALTYTISAVNNGPDIATGARVRDTVPVPLASFTWTCAQPSGACHPASGTGNVDTLVDLAPGQVATITLTGTLPANQLDPLTNVATITEPPGYEVVCPTGNPDCRTSTVVVDPEPRANLTTTKTPPASILRGGTATYTVTVTNNGPSDAPAVTLDDPTPPGLVLVSAGAPCEGGFPCALGAFAPGATASVLVTLEVPTSYAGPTPIVNTACATSSATDPDPADNCAQTTTPLTEVADLQVTKTVDNPAPPVGGTVRFTITATNLGPSPAGNIALVDQMPLGLVFVSASPSQGTYDAATGRWAIGALANGASATLTLDATVTTSGPLANVATITETDTFDPDTSNNTTGSALNVDTAADLQVHKVADVSIVTIGTDVTYTITVRNAGPDEAPAVQIADTLPAGLTFVAATPSVGSYDAATGVWTVGALPNGGAATLQLTATVAVVDTLANVASVTGPQIYDPVPENNTSGTTINGVSADLQTVKTADHHELAVGDRVTFTIVVTNNGLGDATGVVVREALPPGLAYVSSTTSQGVYDPGTGLWTVGALTAPQGGASHATLQVVADVLVGGVHQNTATIAASDQPDPTPSNDGSSVEVEGSGGGTDLEATRVWWLYNPEQDTLDFYVDLTNRGDRPTSGPITVMLPLPPGITFHMGPGDWTCEVVGGTNTAACTRADLTLQPGEQITLPLWTKGPLPANASVYAHLTYGPDTNAANNVALLWPCCGGVEGNVDPTTAPVPLVPATEAARAAAMLPETVPANTIDLVVTQDAPAVSIVGTARQLAYTVRIMNQGPQDAIGLTLTDAIPSGATVVSATAPAGTCAVGQVGIACQWERLPVGGTVEVAVVLASFDVGVLTHAVSASATDAEGARTNNQTVLTTELPPDPALDTDGDGMPDAWETKMGLDPAASDSTADADGDGISNFAEYRNGTHPRGFFRRYFAEGVSNAFFATELAVVNPDVAAPATVVLTAQREGDGYTHSHVRQLGPLSRYQVTGTDVLSGAGSFSTLLESDVPVAADRLVAWDAHRYGSSLESALPEPSTTWYFAEGATHGFALYYLLQNPHPTQTAQVEISYLLPAGGPVVKTYTVAPHSRFTIPVHGIPELAATDVSASVVSTNGVAIVAERAMYRDAVGQVMGAGHASAGATQPGTSWFFAEGATGSFFNLYLLLANPGPTPAVVTARYQLPDGTSFEIPYDVAPQSRRTISVAGEDARLAATSVAITLTSTEPIVAERAMWWPGPSVSPEWYEAHDSLGATTTGTKWAIAGGSAGGPDGESTFVLIANQADVAGTARVTVVFEDGTRAEKTFNLAPTSRLTVDVAGEFPEVVGRTFSVLVESLGDAPVPLVVESARYGSPQGVLWGSGGAALATKVQ